MVYKEDVKDILSMENLKNIKVEQIFKLFPLETLKKYRLFPISKNQEHIIVLTDNNPSLPIIDDLEIYINHHIKIKKVSSDIVDELINEYLKNPVETVEGTLEDINKTQLKDYVNVNLDSNVENLEELAQEAPIIRLVNAIIITAIKNRASDIHIEPSLDRTRIRYRIDGILYDQPSPPGNLLSAITTRIKIMANLNIAERR